MYTGDVENGAVLGRKRNKSNKIFKIGSFLEERVFDDR